VNTKAASIIAGALCLVAAPALADPCEANVRGYSPGATVAGQVRYIGDGDSLCVGPGPDPSTWTEIRLADFYAPELHAPGGREAKAALERIVRDRRLVCTATRSDRGRQTYSYDRLIAVCTINGRSVGEIMTRAGVAQGGNGR